MIPTLLFVLVQQIPIGPFEIWNEGPISPCLPYDAQNSIEWPSDPSFGTPDGFGRIVIGDINGDLISDGVTVADGIAVVLWGLSIYDAPVRIEFPTQSPPVAVADVAILRGQGPDARDVLVMTDERGLYLVTYTGDGFSDPELIAGSPLAFASPIHVEFVDSGDEPDILALGTDKRTIFQSLNSGGGGFTTSVLVTEPYDVFDMITVNWDQVGGRELVAATKRGLIAHTLGGVYLGGSLHHATWGCITRLETSGVTGGEIVAWTRPVNNAPSQLVLKSSTTTEGPWNLTFDVCGTTLDIHPSAILAGLYDENGDQDLLIAHEAAPTAFVLANTGTAGAHFDLTSIYNYDILALTDGPVGGQGGIGIPAFTQVDGVDSDDLVFPVSASQQVDVFLFYPFARAVLGTGVTSADVVSSRTEYGPDGPTINRLRLAFQVPPRYATFTHIEIKVWAQPNPPAAVEPLAVDFFSFMLMQSSGLVEPVRQWVTVEPTFLGGECWGAPKANYYVEFRFAKQNAVSGNWTKSPPFPGGFTMEDCIAPTDYGYLVDFVVPGTDPFPLYADNDLQADPPGTMSFMDRNQLGLYVPMNSQPPFDDNVTPSFPDLRAIGEYAHPFAVE